MRGSEKKATKTGRRPRRGTPSRKGARGPVCRWDKFVVLVGGTFKSGPMSAERALLDAKHFGATIYRLVPAPFAEVVDRCCTGTGTEGAGD